MRYYASIESYKDSGAGQNGLFGSDYSVVAQGRSVRGVKEAFVPMQCPKLRFYFVHPPCALLLKLCTREIPHATSWYIVMITSSKNMHTLGAPFQNSCTRQWKCAHRAQGAPLISDTAMSILYVKTERNRQYTVYECFHASSG